jgi:hypothetical protein
MTFKDNPSGPIAPKVEFIRPEEPPKTELIPTYDNDVNNLNTPNQYSPDVEYNQDYPGMAGFYLSATSDTDTAPALTPGVSTRSEYEAGKMIDSYIESNIPQSEPQKVTTEMINNGFQFDTSNLGPDSIIQPAPQLNQQGIAFAETAQPIGSALDNLKPENNTLPENYPSTGKQILAATIGMLSSALAPIIPFAADLASVTNLSKEQADAYQQVNGSVPYLLRPLGTTEYGYTVTGSTLGIVNSDFQPPVPDYAQQGFSTEADRSRFIDALNSGETVHMTFKDNPSGPIAPKVEFIRPEEPPRLEPVKVDTDP